MARFALEQERIDDGAKAEGIDRQRRACHRAKDERAPDGPRHLERRTGNEGGVIEREEPSGFAGGLVEVFQQRVGDPRKHTDADPASIALPVHA